jgi:K+-sensing histidine kinase KdpD
VVLHTADNSGCSGQAIVGGQLWTIHSRRGRLHPGQRVWVADISHNALIVANTNAALVLVLLVVAAAATGVRTAGVAAALSSALWFDFFLTQPYQHFTITAQADVETAALLVLVGIAVTEVALWGRRQQALASRKDGYLNGVMRTASLVAAGHPEPEASSRRSPINSSRSSTSTTAASTTTPATSHRPP